MNDEKIIEMERIWKIRDFIQELEYKKDSIINFLISQTKLDDVTKNLWIADVKEFYFNTIVAWEMLSSAANGKLKYLDDSKNFLHIARSHLAKSISELIYYQEELVFNHVKEVEIIFEEIWSIFHHEFESLRPTKKKIKHIPRIIKVSKLEYNLPCSICSKISVKYKIGHGRFDKKKSLVYTGITHSRSLRKELTNTLFEILDSGNLSGVHQFMLEHHSLEGLDAYCPECDKIYCWVHYNAREEFDDGFYDCTCGECPNGHQRMIDD